MKIHPLILVIDDESKIRRFVCQSLEREGFDVASAGDGEEALEVFEALSEKPDLVIVDYMMPEMDGLDFLEEFRKSASTPVIFLSARSETSVKTKALEAGADDYVVKPFSVEELTARVKAVLRRVGSQTDSTVTQDLINGPLKMNIGRRKFYFNDKEINLPDIEFRLMTVLMKKPGIVFTHEDLLRQVWGAEFIGETNYLRVSLARIRKKLRAAGLEEPLISSYSGIGYYMEDYSE